MYTPTARLLTVLELLQSYGELSGTELAQKIEVSKRSIRRYILILQDMGIPIESERGRYGTYKLQRGTKLPPLIFTESEAIAMTLGLLTLRELGFSLELMSVDTALVKTERVMPEKLLHQVKALRENIVFNYSLSPTSLKADLIATLSLSVQQQQRVHLTYLSRNDKESKRLFDPYGIVFHEGYWYTAGYCHLREDVRIFRLDRIVSIQTSESTFKCPEKFDLLKYVLHSLGSILASYQVEVIMKTSLENARRFISPDIGIIESSDEGVVFRRKSDYLEWIAHFLMNLDFPIFVVQPIELKTMLRQMASKALEMAGS